MPKRTTKLPKIRKIKGIPIFKRGFKRDRKR